MTDEQQSEDSVGAEVVIHYCALCQWQLRAAWMAQEILQTFAISEVSQVALRPGEGGVFRIWSTRNSATHVIWDRCEDGGFPDSKELKRRLRSTVCPEKDLGHYDSKPVVKQPSYR